MGGGNKVTNALSDSQSPGQPRLKVDSSGAPAESCILKCENVPGKVKRCFEMCPLCGGPEKYEQGKKIPKDQALRSGSTPTALLMLAPQTAQSGPWLADCQYVPAARCPPGPPSHVFSFPSCLLALL